MNDGGTRELTPLEVVLQKEPDVLEALLAFARRRSASAAAAEDLLGDTLRLAIQRERTADRWDPSGKVTALAHLGAVMRGVRANDRRYEKRHPVERVDDPDGAPGGSLDPERALIEREEALERERIKREVRERLADDSNGAIPLAMLDAADQGIRGHKKLADHIGCSIEKVRLAHKRITYHAKQLVKRAGGEEVRP